MASWNYIIYINMLHRLRRRKTGLEERARVLLGTPTTSIEHSFVSPGWKLFCFQSS